MLRKTLLLGLLLGTTPVLADGYTVDPAGGPLTLTEDVEAAFAAWLEAGLSEVPELTAGATTEFRFGAAELMGPDLVTLTVQRSAPDAALHIVVNPDTYVEFPAALVHEAGLVLGLTSSTEGVMNPLLSDDSEGRPRQAEVDRLQAQQTAVPGDLTGDGRVDFDDLLELAAQFGRRGVNQPGDLDGDGTVTLDDLRLLRENYLFTEPRDRTLEPTEDETDQGEAGTAATTPEQ